MSSASINVTIGNRTWEFTPQEAILLWLHLSEIFDLADTPIEGYVRKEAEPEPADETASSPDDVPGQ
jgi:hypothetical protein